MRLKGKVAIITGAGSVGPGPTLGTGCATAIRFAQEGARLVLVDRDPEAVERTQAMLRAEGFDGSMLIGDVVKAETAAAAVALAVEAHGGLDIVVNNVGIVGPSGLLTETEENWDRVFAVNLKSAFLMCRAAVPAMLERGGGAFVSISSTAAHRSTGSSAYAYGVSKAALAHFSRILAIEFAHQNIRSNVVTPGMLDTPLIHNLKARFGWSDAQFEAFQQSRAAQSPTGKQGNAMDIANAVLYVASDEAVFVNGQEIIVDGGQINVAPGGSHKA
jgi:NAD(P)-dependent dehydrogenase (short-subunit alcohol dehydrogenase family)